MAVISDRLGMVRVDDRYRDRLKAIGLDSFAAFMDFTGGGPVRDKGVRTIERVALPGEPAEILYLKRHRRCSIWGAVKGLLRGRRPASEAAREWGAILKVRAAGIDTMMPVAFGERRRFPWLGPSFILTADVGGRRLEDYVQLLCGKFLEKRGIITALADCARRLHRAGLNHKDLYLSHVFLRTSGLALIDLQRVESKARDANRWVVKDLAALNYSSPASVVTRADRMRFLHRYLGVTALDASDKAFLKRIHRKTERIRRHDLRIKN